MPNRAITRSFRRALPTKVKPRDWRGVARLTENRACGLVNRVLPDHVRQPVGTKQHSVASFKTELCTSTLTSAESPPTAFVITWRQRWSAASSDALLPP